MKNCVLLFVFATLFALLRAQEAGNDQITFLENGEYNCNVNEFADQLLSLDGFLELKCHPIFRKCEHLNQPPICDLQWRESCPPRFYVIGIRGYFVGRQKWLKYQVRCCTHPLFQSRYYLGQTPRDFEPVDGFDSVANNRGSRILEFLTNIYATEKRDHQRIGVSRVLCEEKTTTARPTTTTVRPSTRNPEYEEYYDNYDDYTSDEDFKRKGPKPTLDPNYKDYYENYGDEPEDPFEADEEYKSNPSAPTKDPSLYEDYYALYKDYSPEEVPYEQKPGRPDAEANPFPKENGPACFSAEQLVQTKGAIKRMDELKIRDEVLSSLWDGSMSTYQPVTNFLHRDEALVTEFVRLHTTHGQNITLSPDHMLALFPCHQIPSPRSLVQSFTFAKRAHRGDCVLVLDANGRMISSPVSHVTRIRLRGIFSPLTASGTIVVNGIQASCYSSIENHALQHMFFAQAYKLGSVVNGWLQILFDFVGQTVGDDGDLPHVIRLLLFVSKTILSYV